MGKYQEVKNLVRSYFDELEKCAPEEAEAVLKKYMSEDYVWEGVYPFLDQKGTQAVANIFWMPLKKSMVRMQRRQDVFMAGTRLTERPGL